MLRTKCLSLVLVLALALTLLPGGAMAAGDFSDVHDTDTARDVAVLRMLGVLDGYPDGSFRPQDTLTRAQFCKMTVVLMGREDAVGQYKSYTIFPDVRASHWAAGYVNLATRGESKLIAGYPNGTFQPEAAITYGQAVTILMRLLGYADTDVGAVWPDGYLAVAATAGVTQGLTLGAGSSLTRAQAARLFVNLLAASGKESAASYAETIAVSVLADAILLDADAQADDGTAGAVQTSQGTYKTASRPASPLLEGSKGDLLLDKDQRVMAFVPTRGATSRTITLSTAKGDELIDAMGAGYTIAGNTRVYRDGEETTYGEVFKTLRSGQTATLFYTAAGGVDYLFLGGALSDQGVVVAADGSAAGFSTLAGGSSYTLYKNGVEATAADLKKNDVAVYDSAARAIRVSDNKLTAVYEDVYPNREAPARITLLGEEFTVLPSAMASLSAFKLGDRMTVLLTADNQIGGAIAPTGTQSNAVGVVTAASESSATVELFSGITVSGDPGLKDERRAAELVGVLVRVSSSGRGKISLSQLSAGATGDMDVAARKVGGASLAPNVVIYEKSASSAATRVALEELTMAKIPASKIDYARRDWAGRIDLLVLNDATRDNYHYGLLRFTEAESGDSDDVNDTGTPANISVTNGTDTYGPYNSLSGYKSNTYGGLIPTADGSRVAKAVTLTKLGTVGNAAWMGDDYINVGGVLYPIAANIQCYNKSSEGWMTLAAARSFADQFELYADATPDQGGKIRVLVVSQ